MIYILLFALIVLFSISLIFSKYDLISPWVISVGVYILSVVAVIINKENWDITIYANTVFIILVGLIFFGVGEILSRSIFSEKIKKNSIIEKKSRIKYSNKIHIIIYMFCFITLILYFIKIRSIAYQVGYQPGKDLLIQYARLGILNKGISIGATLAIITLLLRSIAYVYMFVFLYNNILCVKNKKIEDIHLLIPPALYLIQYSLGGSRGGLIEFIVYILILSFLLRSKIIKNKVKNNIKIIKYCLIGLGSFLFIFVMLGALKGWELNNIKSTVSLYMGGSILALDRYLNNYIDINIVFGQESLLGINHILYLLGIYEIDSSRALEFINIAPNIVTNIYTALRRYIQDYGYMGTLIIQFILGFLFNTMYIFVAKSRKINYSIIIYAMLFMTVVYQSIDEQFLVSLLSVTQILTIIPTFMIFKFSLQKKLNKL